MEILVRIGKEKAESIFTYKREKQSFGRKGREAKNKGEELKGT